MARIFFHSTNGKNEIVDSIGSDIDVNDIEAIRETAIDTAYEAIEVGGSETTLEDWRGWKVIAVTEDREAIIEIEFEELPFRATVDVWTTQAIATRPDVAEWELRTGVGSVYAVIGYQEYAAFPVDGNSCYRPMTDFTLFEVACYVAEQIEEDDREWAREVEGYIVGIAVRSIESGECETINKALDLATSEEGLSLVSSHMSPHTRDYADLELAVEILGEGRMLNAISNAWARIEAAA